MLHDDVVMSYDYQDGRVSRKREGDEMTTIDLGGKFGRALGFENGN